MLLVTADVEDADHPTEVAHCDHQQVGRGHRSKPGVWLRTHPRACYSQPPKRASSTYECDRIDPQPSPRNFGTNKRLLACHRKKPNHQNSTRCEQTRDQGNALRNLKEARSQHGKAAEPNSK
eukprot:gnl/TRDRNA2_/TRDRNA2_175261_c3_seq2.p2 gnl/TRDRNA2_/TRDRNA2_175261_c3~~gnl/TRDRNA2_/TRDRNA2_175261_c3_seq2.p2  ORF type:complete len:122 (-),score=13.19 gnl/TRDRNA2_/TRDRNA2_175261_c3_seq2:74-439(-)